MLRVQSPLQEPCHKATCDQLCWALIGLLSFQTELPSTEPHAWKDLSTPGDLIQKLMRYPVPAEET